MGGRQRQRGGRGGEGKAHSQRDRQGQNIWRKRRREGGIGVYAVKFK